MMDSVLVLIALALAPGIYLSVVIYGKDKYDREPKKILLVAFLLGAIAVLPAGYLEIYVEKWVDYEDSGITKVLIDSFLIVALAEEGLKFLILRLHAYRKVEFNEPFDGIVYATFVSLGFATAENLFYVVQDGFQTGVLRMFSAVPAHYAFGVIMGYYVGKAKFDEEHRTAHLLRGLFFAVIMHGAYDFFILQKNYPGLAVFTFGVLVMGLRIAKRSVDELQADSVFRFQAKPVSEKVFPHERTDNEP